MRDLGTNLLVVDTNTSSTSYTANLNPGTQYRWNVNACNSSGCSNYTTPLYFVTPAAGPGVPVLTLTAECSGTTSQIRLNWTAASGATSYDVYRNFAVYATGITGTQFINTAVTPGTAYSYSVLARNSSGSTGSATQSATALNCASPAPVISGLSPSSYPASGSSQTLTVNGSNFVSGATLTFHDPQGNPYPGRGTTFISNSQLTHPFNNGSDAGTWTVFVVNPDGQTSNTWSFTVTAAGPGVPALTLTAECSGTTSQIRLNWTAASGATSYDVYRNFAVYATGITDTQFINTVVTPGTAYSYSVLARNSSGSTGSATQSATAPSCASPAPVISGLSPSSYPASGSSQTLTVNGSNFVSGATLTFHDPQGNPYPGRSTTFISNSQLTHPFNNGSDAGTWTVFVVNPDGQTSNTWSFTVTSTGPGSPVLSSSAPVCDTNPPVAPAVRLNWTVASGATSYDLYRNGSVYVAGLTGTTFYNSANVVAGQSYTYFIRARSSGGSTDSNTITISIPANICQSTASPPVINTITPATVTTNQTIVLTVNGSNFQPNFTASVQTSSGTYSIASVGLTFVNSNQVKVQVTMGGTSSYSATLIVTNPNGQNASGSFQVTLQAQIPGALTLSNQSAVCDTGATPAPAIRLNWTASNGASSYDVFRNGSPYNTGLVGTTFYDATNVAAGQTYTYFIRARNSAGTTDSNSITVSVPANLCTGSSSAPTIAKITPDPVVVNQTTILTIIGSNFQNNFSVSVQGNNIDPSGLKFINTGEVTVSVRMGGSAPYQATLRLTNLADGQSATSAFTVVASTTPQPVASFTFSPDSPLVNQAVQFNATSNTSTVNYDWDFEGNGTITSHSQNPSYIFITAGPHTVTLKVSNAYGADSLTKTVMIGAAASGTPAITAVTRNYSGFFIKGSGLDNPFSVNVDWKGSPGTVSFSINGGAPIVRTGSAIGASYSFNLDRDFTPSFSPSVIRISATNSAGGKVDAPPQYLYVFPWPTWLTETLGRDSSALRFTVGNGDVTASFHFDFPVPHLAPNDCVDIPSWVPYIGGKFGMKETYASVNGSVSSHGTGTLRLGGQSGFCALGQSLGGSVGGSGNFLLNESGLSLRSASFNVNLNGTLTKEVGVVDAIPQLAALEQIPVIGLPLKWFNQRATLEGEISPSLGFSANWSQNQTTGGLKFSDANGTLGLDLKGTLKVKLIDSVQASGYVSGGGSFTVGVPDPFVRSWTVTFESGVKLDINYLWTSTSLSKKASFSCNWTPASGTKCGKDSASIATSQLTRILSDAQSANVPLVLIQPNYNRFGSYSVFHPKEQLIKAASSSTPLSVSETSFLTNVFPGASPYLTQVGNGSLLMWVYQDPVLPVLQSTGISWSFNDGGGWSTPGIISADNRTELSPVAGVDTNGKVVAAWLRIKDANFNTPINTTADLPLFYNRIDVVTSTFDPSAKTWGPINQVTNDAVFDNNLRLSSDKTGQLLLSWLSNPGGEFTSSATSPSKLNYSFWNGSSWATPSIIDNNVIGISTHSTAVFGNTAFIIVPRTPDPSVPAIGVLDLYKWNGSTWSAPSTFAGPESDNRLATTLYDEDGEGHVVWLRGGDLVHATLSDPTPRIVRKGSSSMAFYNVRLLRGPQGILTLVWQEVVDNGPANIFAMFYDPATQSWSADRRLTEDQNLAHDVHGYYGSDGQLHLAYLATRVDRTTDTVVIDGQTQTITNVPQDGQTDFRLLDHSLIADLAITDKDITINSQQSQEGDNVTVAVDVHNAGDFAIGNFMVNLYNGDPNTGGLLLGSAVISDSLRAGDHRVVPFNFNLPSGVANMIAVVDPNNTVTEFSKTNNLATLYLNNTAPNASVTASVTSGTVALPVDFDASSSFDNEGDAMSFVWTFADGTASVSGIKVSHIFDQAGVYPVTLTVTDAHGAVGTAVVNITVTASSFQVLTEQSGPNSNQAAAVDAVLFRRDPFPVVGGNGPVNQGSDQNTRVMIFVASLQLAPSETPAAVIINLVDSNSQSYDVPAEDVRLVPNFDFTEVVFRLPTGLASGNCSIRVKAHNQITNAGSIRIK